jgi:hypothetical protein
MARISDLDVQELRQFFEEGLNQAQSADKRHKMRMRRKIRDEVFNLLTWEKPTPTGIMNRWEERLHDVFNVMPFGFKEELFKMLVDKMQHPLKMRKSDKQDILKSNRPFNPFK